MVRLRWIKLAHIMPHVMWYCKLKKSKSSRKLKANCKDAPHKKASNPSPSSSSSSSSSTSSSSSQSKEQMKLASLGASISSSSSNTNTNTNTNNNKNSIIFKAIPFNHKGYSNKKRKNNFEGIPYHYKNNINNHGNGNSCYSESPCRKSSPLRELIKEEEAEAFVNLYNDNHRNHHHHHYHHHRHHHHDQDPSSNPTTYPDLIYNLREIPSQLKSLHNHLVNDSAKSHGDAYDHQCGVLMPSSPILHEGSSSSGKNFAYNNSHLIQDGHIVMKSLDMYRNCSSLVSSPLNSIDRGSYWRQISSSSVPNPSARHNVHHTTYANCSGMSMIESTSPQAPNVVDGNDLLDTTNYARFNQQHIIAKSPSKLLDLSEGHPNLAREKIISESLSNMTPNTSISMVSYPNLCSMSPTFCPNTNATRTSPPKHHMETAITGNHGVASSMYLRSDVHGHPESMTTSTTCNSPSTSCVPHHPYHCRNRSLEYKKLVESSCPYRDSKWHHHHGIRGPKGELCGDYHHQAWQKDDPLCAQCVYGTKLKDVVGQPCGVHDGLQRVRNGVSARNRRRHDAYGQSRVHMGPVRRFVRGSSCDDPDIVTSGYAGQQDRQRQEGPPRHLQRKVRKLLAQQKQHRRRLRQHPQEKGSSNSMKRGSRIGAPSAKTVAMVKRSEDPHHDFKESMMEMINAGGGAIIRESSDLVELLRCYLSLNPRHYHGTIVDVFVDVWSHHLNLSLTH